MKARHRDAKRIAPQVKHRESNARDLAPKVTTGFALTSLVPILLALYLLLGAGRLEREALLGEQGLLLALMLASAGLGFWFIKSELTRTFVTLLERVSAEATGVVGNRIREASVDEIARISATIEHITADLERQAKEAQQAKSRLRSGITKVALAIHASRDEQALLEFVVEGAREAVRASSAYLVQVDEEEGEFVVTIAAGDEAETMRGRRIPLGTGVPGLTAREHRPLLLQDMEEESQGVGLAQLPRSTVSTPLFRGETLHGIIIAHRREGARFTEDDLAVLANLGAFTASAIARRQDTGELESEIDRIVSAFVTAIEERDPYARGHAARVSRYCEEMAIALGLDEETVRMVRRAGLIHDIGKIALPDTLLKKEGTITPDELEHVRNHVIIGEKILRSAGGFASLAPMVRHHHESFDGTGYPDGLKGEEIPLPTHILIVANAFDVLTSDRTFRQAMSLKDALTKLQEGAGKQYDPRTVRALLGLDPSLLKATGHPTREGAGVKDQGAASISVRE